MGIRLKTKKLIYSGLAGGALTLALCSAGGFYLYSEAQEKEIALIKKYEARIDELELTAAQNHTAYSLKKDVQKGTTITPGMLQPVYIPDGGNSTDVIGTEDLKKGKSFKFHAKTDLKAKTILVESMLYDSENITNDMREAEYSFIEVPTNIKTDSYVDIRIQFPTGDDFIVLTKKKIKNIAGVTVWMDIEEAELLTVSSAIVDAYVEGAKIYAIPYVDEHMQEKSIMTYPIKNNVKELIVESPNIVSIAQLFLEKQNRARLDNNLKVMSEEQKSKIDVGDKKVKSNVSEENARATEEERLNEINRQAEQQQALVGGTE